MSKISKKYSFTPKPEAVKVVDDMNKIVSITVLIIPSKQDQI